MPARAYVDVHMADTDDFSFLPVNSRVAHVQIADGVQITAAGPDVLGSLAGKLADAAALWQQVIEQERDR